MSKELDLVIFGATGYTGGVIAEHLALGGANRQLTWGIAGQSLIELEKRANDLALPAGIAMIVADAADRDSLLRMCGRAKVVISTVGPYELYGSLLIEACAEAGADYVDLSGESPWMRAMIDQHHAKAQQTGARIVFSGGYDSTPFDLAVLLIQNAARDSFGISAHTIHGYVVVA